MQSLTQPELLLKPFAESGDKNTIPVNPDAENPQRADLTNGFPAITSEDPDDGGLPPERMDFNALGYLTTSYDYFYQAGGTFTFNTTISTAIGGYPLGARLWYTDGNGATTILRSTIANNTNNFNNGEMTGWTAEIPSLSWNNQWTGNNIFASATFIGATFNGKSDSLNTLTFKTYNSVDTSNGISFANSSGYDIGTIKGSIGSGGDTSSLGMRAYRPGTSGNASFEISMTRDNGDYVYASSGVKKGIIGWGMPNYSAAVTRTSGTEYTATTNGFLFIKQNRNISTSIIINNVTYDIHTVVSNDDFADAALFLPISSGDVYKGINCSWMYFYPCKGE